MAKELEEVERTDVEPEQQWPQDVGVNISAVHPAMAYAAWGFLCIFCGLALAVMGWWIYGFIGALVLFGGAAFAGTMAWFPTQGSARARGVAGFQIWCLGLVIVSGSVTAFCTATAISMLTEKWNQTQLAEKNESRAQTITKSATEAREKGINSKGAAQVSNQVATILSKDAEQERQSIVAEEPDSKWYKEFKLKWIRYVEWFNGIGVLAGMSLLYIIYHKRLDKNGNGTADYLEKEGKGQRRPVMAKVVD